MSTTRTDIHRPSAPEFDPAAYELIDVYDLHPESGDHRDLNKAVEGLAQDGIVQAPHSRGCGHCGQTNLRYVALLVRADVKEWIFVGQDCLVARFTAMTKAKFDALRKAAELARQKQAVKTAWLAFCDANPAMAWASYAENIELGVERELREFEGELVFGRRNQEFLGNGAHDHLLASGLSYHFNTVLDIARKTRRYGEASERQVQLVDKLLAEIPGKLADYQAKMRERMAATGKPTPELVVTGKRQQVEGVVVSRKDQEDLFNPYGGTIWKILVEQADGTRVWGTEPRAFVTEKGAKVSFMAALKASDKDKSFGFFSRPTQFEVMS